MFFEEKDIQYVMKERKSNLSHLDKDYDSFKFLKQSILKLQSTLTMMLNLLQDLLDIAQIDKKSFSLNENYFDLLNTIDKAMTVAAPSSALKNVKLIPPDVPKIEKIYFKNILGDERRYIQILVNFLSNAIKFSNSGDKVEIKL